MSNIHFRFYWRDEDGSWLGSNEYPPVKGVGVSVQYVPFTSGVYENTTVTWFTVEEVAQLLILQPQTVRKMAHNGDIKSSKFSRGFRFHRRDIDQFMQEGENGLGED